jgi:hypothetical protein
MARVNPLYSWRGSVAKSDLPSTSRLVAFALLIWVNEGTVSAWPSQKTLAAACGLTERSVREHLGVLEANGWLICEKREGKTDIWTLSDPTVTPEPPAGVSEATPERGSKTPEPASAELSRTEEQRSGANAPSRRDVVWDVLVEILGQPQTKTERGKRNDAVKQLKDVGATPAEIRRRHGNGRRMWPEVTITDQALVKHWTTLGQTENGFRRRPKGGVSAEEVFSQAGVEYR